MPERANMTPPRGAIRRTLIRIATERTSAARLGCAVALGVVIGMSPFIGLHLAICLVAATLLGLNRAVTYLAANISLPAFAPGLAFASIQVGNRMLVGSWLALDVQTLKGIDPWTFAEAWLLGSLVLGVLIGAPVGLAVAGGVAHYRKRHPVPKDPIGVAMTATAARYARCGRVAFGYIRGKLQHDPVYWQLAVRAPLPSPVVDIGCGRGQTLVLLKMLQPDLMGIGLDWDEPKITLAQRAAEGLDGLTFMTDDARNPTFPVAGTLLLIDLLHYHAPAEQHAILDRAARALQPGGHLYVRDVDNAAGWRAAMARVVERLGRWMKINRGVTLCYLPAAELVASLRAHGLDVRVEPSWGMTPFANVLIEAKRAG